MGIQHPHTGPPCAACEWARGRTFTPSRDFGILIHAEDGRLVDSETVRRLLVP